MGRAQHELAPPQINTAQDYAILSSREMCQRPAPMSQPGISPLRGLNGVMPCKCVEKSRERPRRGTERLGLVQILRFPVYFRNYQI